MTKLLFHSNAPWASTGYGQQTALFAPEIAKHYDMAISSFYGLEGRPIVWEGIPVLPGLGGQFGDDWLVQHAKHFFGGDPRAGLVITLMDVWVLDAGWMRQMNTAAWVPIDSDPAPKRVVDYFTATGAVPIAMSRYGAQMLGRLDPLYVPHAVDCEQYRPYDRKATRRKFGLPKDAFVIGMVAANKGKPGRKGFVQALQAFAKFLETHENSILYLHTMMDPSLAGGEDLTALLEALAVPAENVRVAEQYRVLFDPYGPESMAKMYSCLDVLLNPALGEGFGVTALEAQACGTPVITTDFSAMKEVVGAGWHVKPAAGMGNGYWTGLNAWQKFPDVDDIASALEECHSLTAKQRVQLATGARRHAQEYDLSRVFKQYMLPALKTVEQRFAKQQPVRIKPRGDLKVAA